MNLLDIFWLFLMTSWYIGWIGMILLIIFYYGKFKNNKKLMKISLWLFVCWIIAFVIVSIYLYIFSGAFTILV
jgi:hypothetical protein